MRNNPRYMYRVYFVSKACIVIGKAWFCQQLWRNNPLQGCKAMWFSDSFCKIIWLALVGIMLTGCGGGGSSSTPAAPPVVIDPNLTVPLQTAMANLVNNGFNKPYTLTGWVDNSTGNNPNLPLTPLSGSGTVMIGTPVSVVFTSGPLTGVTALKSVAVSTGTVASTSTYYFNTSDYTILLVQSESKYFYYTPYTLHSTVKAGNTGAIGDSSTGEFFATTTTTGVYSVDSDKADSLLVTFTETSSNFFSEVITSTKYRITTLGKISPVSITSDYYLTGHYKHVVLTF